MARFLEGQGLKDLALEVATDPDHKFDLALSLNRLDIALELARAADVEHKWKSVGGEYPCNLSVMPLLYRTNNYLQKMRHSRHGT